MTNKPGVALVHITPGIANSVSNLFNAWRSQMPLVLLVAQQQNELVTQEPLLESNLLEVGRQYCKWAHAVRTPAEVPMVLQRAFKEAMAPPNGPVLITFPWEYMMQEIEPGSRVKGITRISPNFTGDPVAIDDAVQRLVSAQNPIIVCGDGIGDDDAWPEIQELAHLLGAPVTLQTFSSVANFPNDDYHWQGELPGIQSQIQAVFQEHDVAFLIGYHAQAQLTVFKYSNGPLIPNHVHQIYLMNNTWDIGKNYYGETAILGGIKTNLRRINELVCQTPPPEASTRNQYLEALSKTRAENWADYIAMAMAQNEIWAVVIAEALRQEIEARQLHSDFVYVHEAVSDPAPFQYLLPLGTGGAKPISYYCVAGGSLGWSMPASLGIKLNPDGWQGIKTQLVVNAIGDGSTLFSPQAWWTAAHQGLAVLYIITNNHEYHTLQIGLQQVIGAYGEAPGYHWHPKTDNPEYLYIKRPKIDFVSLAQAFGGQEGEVVKGPENVAAAVKRGIDYVLSHKKSYILDMRTDPESPPPPPINDEYHQDGQDDQDDQKGTAVTTVKSFQLQERYRMQPPLDYFHRKEKGLVDASDDDDDVDMNLPALF